MREEILSDLRIYVVLQGVHIETSIAATGKSYFYVFGDVASAGTVHLISGDNSLFPEAEDWFVKHRILLQDHKGYAVCALTHTNIIQFKKHSRDSK